GHRIARHHDEGTERHRSLDAPSRNGPDRARHHPHGRHSVVHAHAHGGGRRARVHYQTGGARPATSGRQRGALGGLLMELTDARRDALTELINTAFSRTAASLSELTGNRVELEVHEVSVHPIEELTAALARFVNGDVATVHQVFSGPVAGDALLLLNHDGAVH